MKCIPTLTRLAALTFLFMSAALTVSPQGPRAIAVSDRHLWRESVDTQSGFNKASRAALLVYLRKLQELRESEAKRSDRPSVIKWLDKELELSRSNYLLGSKDCTSSDWTCDGNVGVAGSPGGPSRINVPEDLMAWRADIETFVSHYIAEQVRLAALFPRTTSEIELFDQNEFNGDRLPDRKFFLTFDDGPASAGGNTDDILQTLATEKKTAVFFLLGGNLKSRLSQTGSSSITSLYAGQCIGSHGWEHTPHTATAGWRSGRTWKTSVTDSTYLLTSTFRDREGLLPLFRPPYGQRTADSPAFFRSQGLHIALWNIDSQDWNSKVNAEDVTNRIETLMLIKRHGILLFHDIHPKAIAAIPTVIHDFRHSVEWGNCHSISEAF